MRQAFDRAGLVDAFQELGRKAHARGSVIEISVYGGSARMLIYDWRVATRDLDAMFEADRTVVRMLAGWSR